MRPSGLARVYRLSEAALVVTAQFSATGPKHGDLCSVANTVTFRRPMPTNIIPFAGIPAPQQFISALPHFPNAGMGQRETHVNHLRQRSSLLSVEMVIGPSAGDGHMGNTPGPTMADRAENQHQQDHKGTVPVCCRSGSRRIRQGCNGCVHPATPLRIRSDGHFFAQGMPDRPRVRPQTGLEPHADFGPLRHFGKGDRGLAEFPGPVI
jgi:hypothetical protein